MSAIRSVYGDTLKTILFRSDSYMQKDARLSFILSRVNWLGLAGVLASTEPATGRGGGNCVMCFPSCSFLSFLLLFLAPTQNSKASRQLCSLATFSAVCAHLKRKSHLPWISMPLVRLFPPYKPKSVSVCQVYQQVSRSILSAFFFLFSSIFSSLFFFWLILNYIF